MSAAGETRRRAERRPAGRRRSLTVALVGADGAGKSTLSGMLQAPGALPRPVKTIYMGVNLEASSLMLPTTRALLSVKRARTEAPARPEPQDAGHHSDVGQQGGSPLKEAVRLAVWALEEWVRQLAAAWYKARGYIVVFDRHFFADFYHRTASPEADTRGAAARLHDWMLRRLYPKPDLTVCLDAPAEVLYERKQEDSPAFLAQRRQQYLDLATVMPAYALIDATQPLQSVFDDVTETISDHWARSG